MVSPALMFDQLLFIFHPISILMCVYDAEFGNLVQKMERYLEVSLYTVILA